MPHFFISSKDINNDKIVVSDKDNYLGRNFIFKSKIPWKYVSTVNIKEDLKAYSN